MRRILFVAGSLLLLLFGFVLINRFVTIKKLQNNQYIFSCGFCFNKDLTEVIEHTCSKYGYTIVETSFIFESPIAKRQMIVFCKEANDKIIKFNF